MWFSHHDTFKIVLLYIIINDLIYSIKLGTYRMEMTKFIRNVS